MAVPADFREVVVGIVGRAHGVRGEVVIAVRTDEPHRRFAVDQVLWAEDRSRSLIVRSCREHNGRLLATFAGVTDRTAAEALRGVRLVADVPVAEQPEAEGEYYDRQLVGLTVRDATGAAVGVVGGVLHAPAQDLLEVNVGEVTRLVPFVAALVPHVDVDEGFLQLADVSGLLDDLAD